MQNEIIYDALEYNGGGINTLLNGRVVKSVQRGDAFITNGQDNYIEIFSIDVSKSILLVSWAVASNFENHTGIRGRIVSSTQIVLNGANTYKSGMASWQVVEFY